MPKISGTTPQKDSKVSSDTPLASARHSTMPPKPNVPGDTIATATASGARVNASAKSQHPLLGRPVKAFGKLLTSKMQIESFSLQETGKNVPCVFVVERDGSDAQKTSVVLGSDYLDRVIAQDAHEKVDATDFSAHLRLAKEILILLPSGQHHTVDIAHSLRMNPTGNLLRALLDVNTNAKDNEYNEAEIRVKVAAALHLNTFGFQDVELARTMLKPVSDEAKEVAVHRTLIEGVEENHVALVDLMVHWGADVRRPAESEELPPLLIAQRLGNDKMVGYLLSKGATMPTGSPR